MNILRRATSLRVVLLFFVGAALASANPIPSRILFPPLTTTAENVTITVRGTDAAVSGHYRFRSAPDTPERWLRRPFRLALQLPVPVPRSANRFEEIEPLVRPTITIKGRSYRPENGVFHYNVLSLPENAKLAIFFFRVERDDLGGEFEVVMDYHQPIIASGGSNLIYYVPFLPTYEQYKERLGLKPESYLVTFESPPEQPMRLVSPAATVTPPSPQLIAVHPKHLEIIAVETELGAGPRAPHIRLPLTAAPAK